jgi:hypothetical protein
LLAPEKTSVTFRNELRDESGARNRNLYNGSGVALGDFDGDGGWICISARWRAKTNCIGISETGSLRIVTRKAGVQLGKEPSRGAAFADIDGDADLDLLVAVMGKGVVIFRNDGALNSPMSPGRQGLSLPMARWVLLSPM